MTTRYTDGSVTVVLDDGLERFVRGAMERASAGVVEKLEAEAATLAEQARRDWYGPDGVTRETGLSGDIRVVTTIDAGRSEVRVSIGSADRRTAGKTSKPLPALVHRPGRLSLVPQTVSQGEWWAWLKAGKPVLSKPRRAGAPWQILVSNPRASDGKYLLIEHVRTPGRVLVKRVAPELGALIARRVDRG